MSRLLLLFCGNVYYSVQHVQARFRTGKKILACLEFFVYNYYFRYVSSFRCFSIAQYRYAIFYLMDRLPFMKISGD